jgi:hypothetical protein
VIRPLLIVVAGVLAALVLGVACGSSDSPPSNFTCCFNINGAKSYWKCPDQAAFNGCCLGGQNAGCVNDNPGTCIPDPNPPSDCTT